MNIWNLYKNKIKETIIDPKIDEGAIDYWRLQFFLTVITLYIPIATIGSIFGIVMALNNNLMLLVCVDLGVWILSLGIGFFKNIQPWMRRWTLIGVLYFQAGSMLLSLGHFGPGSLWLIFISVLAALIIPFNTTYIIVLINLLVYLTIAILASTHIIHSRMFDAFTPHSWVSVGVSLMAINIISITTINKLVVNLENKILSLTMLQKHLSESEEKLRIIFSSIRDGIIVADMEGKLLQMNDVAQYMTGWSFEEAQRSNIERVYITRDTYTDVSINNTPDKLLANYYLEKHQNVKVISRSGNVYDITYSVSPLATHEGGTLGLIIIFRDITFEKKKDEEQLQSKKMEAIGRLAGGVAHDFNNMLTGIMGFTELLEIRLQGQPKLENYCREILKTSERAAELTSQLLTFSHKRNNEKKPLSLNKTITDAIKLLEPTLNPNIHIEVDLTKQSTYMTGDIAQIQNAILNLSINARDAMKDGGTLKISTQVKELSEKDCMRSEFNLKPGPFVVLKMSDEGSGMNQATCARIFEPFFTTKVIGRGTGLGLATVYGSVVGHQGSITVHSQEGVGTTFYLLFPHLEMVTEVMNHEALPKEAVENKKGYALIVDDEEPIRVLFKDMLSHLGYKTLIAENGREGINLYQAYHWEISLVILDVIMPKMGGKEVLVELMKIDTEVPIIIASGYIDDEQTSTFEALGSSAFMKKPFKMGELVRVIENIS